MIYSQLELLNSIIMSRDSIYVVALSVFSFEVPIRSTKLRTSTAAVF